MAGKPTLSGITSSIQGTGEELSSAKTDVFWASMRWEIDQFSWTIAIETSIKYQSPAATAMQHVLSRPRLMVGIFPGFAGGEHGKDQPDPKRPKGNPKVKPPNPTLTSNKRF